MLSFARRGVGRRAAAYEAPAASNLSAFRAPDRASIGFRVLLGLYNLLADCVGWLPGTRHIFGIFWVGLRIIYRSFLVRSEDWGVDSRVAMDFAGLSAGARQVCFERLQKVGASQNSTVLVTLSGFGGQEYPMFVWWGWGGRTTVLNDTQVFEDRSKVRDINSYCSTVIKAEG